MTGNLRPGLAAGSPWMGRVDGGEILQLHGGANAFMGSGSNKESRKQLPGPETELFVQNPPAWDMSDREKASLNRQTSLFSLPPGDGHLLGDPTPVAW